MNSINGIENNPRNLIINEKQVLFIKKYIDVNFEELRVALGINEGFDNFKLKELIFIELKRILLKLKEEISSTFGTYSIPGTYEILMHLSEIRLGLIEFDFQLFRYKSLDEAVLTKAILDRQLLNRIRLITRDILDNKFGRIFSTLEDDVAQLKNSYQFSIPYKLTDKGIELLDEFLKFEGSSVVKLLNNAHNARSSHMEVYAGKPSSSAVAEAI